VTRRRLGASLAQRVNEALAIRIIHDDQFAPVTIIHDVRQQTRLSICGPCQESGFGRYTYQHQELTPLTRLRHRDKVRSGQFAKTHNWVVTASDDASAVVWDASTGEPLTMPLMHVEGIISAVFTDRDSAIITIDEMGNQWRWDLQPDRKAKSEMPQQHSSP